MPNKWWTFYSISLVCTYLDMLGTETYSFKRDYWGFLNSSNLVGNQSGHVFAQTDISVDNQYKELISAENHRSQTEPSTTMIKMATTLLVSLLIATTLVGTVIVGEHTKINYVDFKN